MFLDSVYVNNLNVYETIKDISHCSICTGILIEPQQCLKCDCCFCKKCLNDWLLKSQSCPFKCENSSFKESRLAKQMLSRLNFNCPFNCKIILSYDEILNHEETCENLFAECPTCKTLVAKSKIKEIENEKIIKSLKEEIELLKKKILGKDSDVDHIPIMFRNLRRTFETPPGNFLRTFSCSNQLPENFRINLKFIKLNHPGHLVVGVSDRIFLNEHVGYLGGDMGGGNWGIAGNGSLGEEGKWRKRNGFKQGDLISLQGRGSVISYLINGVDDGYVYDIKKKPLYFCISFYHENEQLELIIA